MTLQPQEILRNTGGPSRSNPAVYVRKLLIQRGGRKAWVVADGPDQAKATELVYLAAEAKLQEWASVDRVRKLREVGRNE
jgi:hypothetical protein